MVAVRQRAVWVSSAAVGGVSLYTLYALGVPLLTLTDTCTMGGDGLWPELIVGVPLATLSGVLLALGRSAESRPIRRSIIVLTGFFLLYLVPQLVSVSILGHHYCGEEYDGYLQYSHPVERWLPFGQLLLVSMVALVGLRAGAPRDVA